MATVVTPEELAVELRLMAHPFTGPACLTDTERAFLIRVAQWVDDVRHALDDPAVRLASYTHASALGIDEVRRIEAEGGDDDEQG